MITTSIEALETAFAPCKTCGREFEFESLWIGRIDFGRTMRPDCPACQERKTREDAERDRRAMMERREETIRGQIPPDLLATDPDHESFNYGLWSVTRQWRPYGDFWLGLVGPAGTCKTRCMALLAADLIRDGVRVCWTTANRLKDASDDRKSLDGSARTLAREHLAECRAAGWLFLDDLGKNEWTQAFESQFFQLLDHRKNHRLPVVYSSNARPEEFSQVISKLNAWPIIGRLKDRTTLIDLFS